MSGTSQATAVVSGIVALMLAATGMGYQSCPMIGFDIDEVAKLINLPDDHVMGPMVAIGKGTKEPWPKPGLGDSGGASVKARHHPGENSSLRLL